MLKKKKLKIFSNIVFILAIVYFVYMIISDIYYIINNKYDITQSIPVGLKNIIHIIIMLVPYLIILIILFIIEKKCKNQQISTLNTKVVNCIKKNIKFVISMIIVIIVIIFLLAIYLLQDKLIYHPYDDELTRYNLISSKEELKLEQITIEQGNTKYYGWGRKNGKNKPTIIYYGGNAQIADITFYTMEDSWKYYDNFNYIMVDYPGYGMSSGSPNYKTIQEMALATYDYVDDDKYFGNNEIIIMGFSIGTGPATYVAANRENSKLILVAPYNNGIDLYNSNINIFYGPLKNMVKNKYPSDKLAESIKEPTLIISSKDDEIIKYELSKKLSEKFENIKFSTYKNLSHNDLMNNDFVLKEINKFLKN